jgi:hypothetical protein
MQKRPPLVHFQYDESLRILLYLILPSGCSRLFRLLRPNFRQYKIARKVIVTCIIIFRLLDTEWLDRPRNSVIANYD